MKQLKKAIPPLSGVYLFKNAAGEVIYIGKAKSLKNRVRSYFQKTYDWKVQSIIQEHDDLEYILTKNETEALILETELIRKYQPKYNILAKTGQPFVYLFFSSNIRILPTLKIVRNKKLKGTYFGPFFQKRDARRVYRFLMRTFKLNLCNKKIEHGCLDYHLGNCPGNCKPDFDTNEYLFRLDLAKEALRANHKKFLKQLHDKIAEYNQQFNFEKARHLSEYIQNLDAIFETIRTHYSEKKFHTDVFVATAQRPYVAQTHSVSEQLQEFLGHSVPIRSIDCFDISHFQSRNIVGSCVRFTNGIPEKNKFRRFNIKTLTEQNDYAALREIVQRRYKDGDDLPDLILIDGGKGQLNAVQDLYPQASFISLAKREERVFGNQLTPQGVRLDLQTDVGKLLIALRDYAHHFAISFHRIKRKKDI